MEYPIGGQIFMSKLIEERDFGEYEGVEDYLIDWEVLNKDSKENREMGVESLAEMKKRINLFLEDLKLEDNNLTILVVTHAGPIRMMKSKLTKKEIDFEEIIENGSITEFDYDTYLEN
jgi:broad specificity phosphatase PhoE